MTGATTEDAAAPPPHPRRGASPAPGEATSGRLVTAAAGSLADHLALHGPVPWRGGPGRLIDDLRAAGLTGRGGAGFPAWRKLAAVRDGAGGDPRDRGSVWTGPPTVIANAAEGEPESAKDAWLATAAPHLVLDGLALVAEAVSAADAHVYVKAGPAAQSLARAVAQRGPAGVDRLPPRVQPAPDGFVSGEASAAAAAVDGGFAKPFPQFVPLSAPAARGEGRTGRLRRPVVVCNAETLAHLALLARRGAAWFREAGTADEPGTMLVTVSGAVASPGVVEVPVGATLGELVRLAGGAPKRPGAVRVGGYGGAWLPADRAHDIPMSRAGLAAWGASPGPGLLHVLPASACGLAETARIASYLAGQSAGQCGPCAFGLPELASATAQLTTSRGMAGRWAKHAAELAAMVDGRGACRHPDGAARLVRSALAVFAADVRAHGGGRCVGSAR